MKNLKLKEKLLEHIEHSHFIKIEREKLDENPMYCVPVSLGENLVLVKNYTDFSFDGFVIIRINDITEVRYNEVDKFAENILRKENPTIDGKAIPFNELKDWKEAFNQLMKLNVYIHIEWDEGEFIKYNLGEIVEVHNNGVTLHSFNALGEWDKVPIEIKYKDVILVSHNDRYTRIFSKYVRNR